MSFLEKSRRAGSRSAYLASLKRLSRKPTVVAWLPLPQDGDVLQSALSVNRHRTAMLFQHWRVLLTRKPPQGEGFKETLYRKVSGGSQNGSRDPGNQFSEKT